jgi:hypothetical protein
MIGDCGTRLSPYSIFEADDRLRRRHVTFTRQMRKYEMNGCLEVTWESCVKQGMPACLWFAELDVRYTRSRDTPNKLGGENANRHLCIVTSTTPTTTEKKFDPSKPHGICE